MKQYLMEQIHGILLVLREGLTCCNNRNFGPPKKKFGINFIKAKILLEFTSQRL